MNNPQPLSNCEQQMTMNNNSHCQTSQTRRFLLAPLLILTAVLLASCDQGSENLATPEWNRQNDREFVATWKVQEIPVLEVSLSYHGKEPELPFTGPEPGTDWKSRDTDFYSCTLTNLTDRPIQLQSVSLELDKGTPANSSPRNSAYLSERWGSDTIPPGGSLTRKNTWVWGKGNKNTLTKTYEAVVSPGTDSSSTDPGLRTLFEERGHAPISFAFQVPLRYQR